MKLKTKLQITLLIVVIWAGISAFFVYSSAKYSAERDQITELISHVTKHTSSFNKSASEYLINQAPRPLQQSKSNLNSLKTLLTELSKILPEKKEEFTLINHEISQVDEILNELVRLYKHREIVSPQDNIRNDLTHSLMNRLTGRILVKTEEIDINAEKIRSFFINKYSQLSGRNNLILLSLLFALLVTSLGTSIWIYGSVVPPLAALLKGIRGLSSGQFENKVVVCRNDELGDISKSFNHMAENIQNYTETLRTQKKILDRSQEIAHLGSWHFDIKHNIFTWSEEVFRIFGKDPQNFKGTYEDFLDAIHPNDRGMVDKEYTDAIKNNVPYECVHRILRPSGEVRVVQDKCEHVIDETGSIGHSFGFTQDITEQFFQNQRYENIIKTSIDGFWLTDKQGRILDVNASYCEMSGYSQEELLRMAIYDLDDNETMTDVEQRIQQLFIAKSLYFETQHRKKDGSLFDVEISSSCVGHDDEVVVFIRNISERKKAENAKKELERRLAQAQKMEAIGTLAGGIAHDFNNILGAILGYAEMVQEDCPTGSIMRSDIDRVVEASHRAKELVKQILAFSRQAESEKIILQPAFIIKEAMKMLRASLPKTIEIQQNIDPEAGLILADPTQIHQIITNLCTNAFHAMEEIGGTLNISLKNKELSLGDLVSEPRVEPGLFVELSVGDTGPGITPELMDKIFDPFFTTKEVGKGTGMGLAITHGIAKKSGGFISCKSSPDEGTTFYVYLPVHTDTALPEAEATPVEIIQTGIEHILFIDDEEMLAEMGKTMLERLGYRVTVETNSIEALKIIQNQPNRFDLLITDQTMPGMTGSDLARRVLQIRPDLPIILCTGFSNLISEEKARIYGIKGFAMKPLAKKDLATLIRKVLDGEKKEG